MRMSRNERNRRITGNKKEYNIVFRITGNYVGSGEKGREGGG